MLGESVVPLVDQGLGNQSYLVDLGAGRALAVDPALDLRALDGAARARGLTVAFAAETHLHADFLSGESGCRVGMALRCWGPGWGVAGSPTSASTTAPRSTSVV